MKKLDELVYNIFSLLRVSISIYDKNTEVIKYSNLDIPLQLIKIIKENKENICEERKNHEYNSVIKLTDSSYFTYISVLLDNNQIIIGPFLEYEYDSIKLNSLKTRLKIIGEDNYLFDDFYNQLLVLKPQNVKFIISILYSLIDDIDTVIKYVNIEGKIITESNLIDSVDMKFENLKYVKQNYETEEELLKVIESGSIEDANAFSTDRIMTHLPDRAINDTLRNEKTRLTILNTICNRAAIKAGLNYQLGHQISTNYGIKIERTKSIYNINKLTKEVIIGYTQAVKDYSLNECSKLVKNGILIIRKNVTHKYTLTDLSNDLFVRCRIS